MCEGNDEEINDPKEILGRLTGSYISKVGTQFKSTMTLRSFLDKYGIELPILPPDEYDFMDMPFSIEEVKQALKSSKKSSAPGPTGQGISLFKYLAKMIPSILLSALNELTFVPGLIHDPAFSWLLHRNIVYIPKPGKAPNKIGNIRPLSLLETLYKIQTKILTNRMGLALEEVLYINQHGFQRNKSIQTATFPVIEAINEAETNNKGLQLISIDIQSAFDTISPESIFQVMRQEKFPNIFVEAMTNLTAKGTGAVSLNSNNGDTFNIECGSGQGNPPSAGNFNLGTDPLIRAVNNVIQDLKYEYNSGLKLPPISYADDHLHGVSLLRADQINRILEVYTDYEKVSGLKISPSKTAILGINTPEDMLRQIHQDTGIQIVDGFRYLGVEIRATVAAMIKDSYGGAHDHQKNKYNKIHIGYLDMWHKKQLISSVILPSYNHIFMALGYDEEWGKKIDNEVVHLMWTQQQGGIVKQKRRLVARRRLNASYEYGGLQLTFTEQVAKGLLVNAVKRIKQQLTLEEDKKLLMTKMVEIEVFRVMGISLRQLFQMAGSQTWKILANGTTFIIFKQMCNAMSSFLKLQEKNRDTWLAMPIMGHSMSPPIFRLTTHEGLILSVHGYTYIAQLFGRQELTGKIDRKIDAELNGVGANLKMKCRALRARLGEMDLSDEYIPGESILKTMDRLRWSSTYKKIYRCSVNDTLPGPPSYFSRQRDGIPVPEMRKFMQGYKKLFKLGLHSKTLETSFLLLNRQIWTNLKQTLSGGDEVDSANCQLCGQIENSMHLMFECEQYSEKIWKVLGECISAIENERISLHAYNVLYNMDINKLNPTKNNQILYLIQEIKRSLIYRRYLRSTGQGGIVNYNNTRICAHLLLVLKKTLYQKRSEGKEHIYLETLAVELTNRI